MSKMTLRFLLVVIATCLATSLVGAEVVPKWNTWPSIRLPRMGVQRSSSTADGSHDTQIHVDNSRTYDAVEADAGLTIGVGFDLEEIERSLSFQVTSAKNLSEVQRTKITIADARDLFDLNNQVADKDPMALHDEVKSRRRRHIFGVDTRYQITDNFREVFPFSAVVQLSTGCSGILIGPKHVLTAAECVHNGRRYRGNVKTLRIGLVRVGNATTATETSSNDVWQDGALSDLDWFDVDQLYLPDGWLSPGFAEKQESFNYAVLTLSQNHEHNCMGVGVSSILNTNYMRRIHFSSFDDYKHHSEPVLAYRHCYIVSDTTNYLYEKCDSTKSSVGAGIYLRMWDSQRWQWSRRVMAVKTSKSERIRIGGKRVRTSRDVRITLLNFGQICYWVMGDFEACSRGSIEDACLRA